MILHDFIYEWDGKSPDGEKPIAWWPGCYHVRIVKTGDDGHGLRHLFPIAVLFKSQKSDAPVSVSLKNYIHNFAEKISVEYGLNIGQVLWMDLSDPVQVAHLEPDRKLSGEPLYSVSWRPIRPNEQIMIDPYLQNF